MTLLKIALTKGRTEKQVIPLLEKSGVDCSGLLNKKRRLIVSVADKYQFVLAKGPDVMTYLTNGACDIGIVGSDILEEQGRTENQLLDLNVGKCRFILASTSSFDIIIGGGTSNPYFSTDTAAALRGIEIEADVLFKGTRVDGVYTADPEKDPAAKKFDAITFDEVYTRNLKVMDMTAFTLCKENGLDIIVFDMDTAGNLHKVLEGETIGTLVHR